MTDSTKVALLKGAGFLVAIGSIGLGFYLIPDEKASLGAALIALITWYVGKLTGESLPVITIQSIRSLPPKRAQQAYRILSHPPKADYENWESEEESKTPVIRGSQRPH